jgi:hypothetical protein
MLLWLWRDGTYFQLLLLPGCEDENSDLTFDGHALGCSLCVDITQDAMRMLDEGRSTAEIRAYVDQTYSRFGPSNMP